MVYTFFPSFPLKNKQFGYPPKLFLGLLRDSVFSELRTPLVYTFLLPIKCMKNPQEREKQEDLEKTREKEQMRHRLHKPTLNLPGTRFGLLHPWWAPASKTLPLSVLRDFLPPFRNNTTMGAFQIPLTLILPQKYRDRNGSCTVIQIGGVHTTFCQEGGTGVGWCSQIDGF